MMPSIHAATRRAPMSPADRYRWRGFVSVQVGRRTVYLETPRQYATHGLAVEAAERLARFAEAAGRLPRGGYVRQPYAMPEPRTLGGVQ